MTIRSTKPRKGRVSDFPPPPTPPAYRKTTRPPDCLSLSLLFGFPFYSPVRPDAGDRFGQGHEKNNLGAAQPMPRTRALATKHKPSAAEPVVESEGWGFCVKDQPHTRHRALSLTDSTSPREQRHGRRRSHTAAAKKRERVKEQKDKPDATGTKKKEKKKRALSLIEVECRDRPRAQPALSLRSALSPIRGVRA